MSARPRAEAMAARLERAAERAGVPRQGRALIGIAFAATMRVRQPLLAEDDPDYLHPARTALILIQDAGVSDAETLAAGVITETRVAHLRANPADAVLLGPAVLALAAAVPSAEREGDGLMEALLLAPEAAGLIALAEWLDHVRHLHLRDAAEWEREHALTCAVYAPFASRIHPVMARRFDWWCGMFARRFLRR